MRVSTGSFQDGQNLNCSYCPEGAFFKNTLKHYTSTDSCFFLFVCLFYMGVFFCVHVGTYSDLIGLYSCKSCYPGRYSPGNGLTSCPSCENGLSQPLFGQRNCSYCLPGTYTNHLTTKTSCHECEAGQQQEATGQTSCYACTGGTFFGSATG